MTGMRKLLLGSVGVVALVSLLTAGFASARPREYVGDFTLTSETRWGKATLPAGHYTFELDVTQDLITVRGQKQAVMVMSWGHDTDNRVDSSALILGSRGGKHIVRALRIAQEKEVFFYAVPKETRKEQEIAQEPVLIERVPIRINGN